MQPQLLTLTPEQAKALLAADQTDSNRAFDKTNCARFVSLIKSGLWRTTHQGIAIAADGRVVDGQHRLTAISEAGIPVQVWIFWDSDPNTFDALDQGKKRTGNDIWKIGGMSSAKNVAAIARLVWCYANVTDSYDWSNTTRDLTSATVFNWAVDNGYGEAISRAANYEARIRKEIKGIGSAVGASIAIAEIYAGIDGETVFERVYEPLIKCIGLQEGMPVYVLHRILSKRDHRDALSSGNIFCTKLTASTNLSRARLNILLRVIADVMQDRQRQMYKFAMTGPMLDMATMAEDPALAWD